MFEEKNNVLYGKKAIVIGDVDGICAEDMIPCVNAAEADIIYSSTECFACSVTGSIDQNVQRDIIKLCEEYDPEQIVVILGVSDPDSAMYTAETLISGDSSGFGPLSDVALNLQVYHIFDPEIRDCFGETYYEKLSSLESSIDTDAVLESIEKMKA